MDKGHAAAAAMAACEARQAAAAKHDAALAARCQFQGELIRKAWQVVLCAQWEQRNRKRAHGASA